MRGLFTAVIAAAALAACGPGRTTFARNPGAAPTFDRAASDPKAVEIADKVLTAAGGADAWNRAKQIRWKMVGETDGKVVIEYDEAWDRWNGRSFGRLHNAAGPSVQDERGGPPKEKLPNEGSVVIQRKLYEGTGKAYFDNGKTLVGLPPDQSERAQHTANEHWQRNTAMLCMPFLLEEPGSKLALDGEEETEPGKPPLDILKVTLDPKEPGRTATYRIMVNRETSAIERIEIQNGAQLYGYKVSERTTAGGITFPSVFTSLGGNEKITYQSFAVGEPDDELFVGPPLQ